MATHEYFAHVGPDGLGPNELARRAGCELPDFYPGGEANNVESIAAGQPDADAAWNDLTSSPGHRVHLLAQEDFYREQTDYGVGYVHLPSAPYHHYWVIITADCQ